MSKLTPTMRKLVFAEDDVRAEFKKYNSYVTNQIKGQITAESVFDECPIELDVDVLREYIYHQIFSKFCEKGERVDDWECRDGYFTVEYI